MDYLDVICTKNWYVQDMRIRNHDEEGDMIGTQGNEKIMELIYSYIL